MPAAAQATRPFGLIELMRPRQWVKNAFVLGPLVFAVAFTRPGAIAHSLIAVLMFCLASSAVYVLNDLRDVALDRAHPRKRLTRPIAAGRVSEAQAKMLLVLLYACLVPGFYLIPNAMGGILMYLGINVAYSFWLKTVPVVDLFCVASGFVLRLWVGALAIAVPLTAWMSITTLCLALYLATIKRRQELIASGGAGRTVLSMYTVPLLDRYAEMSAMGAIVFYGLFTMTVKPELAGTVPLVMFGVFRYGYLVERFEAGESPTDVVWADIPLGLTVLAWGAASVFALWP